MNISQAHRHGAPALTGHTPRNCLAESPAPDGSNDPVAPIVRLRTGPLYSCYRWSVGGPGPPSGALLLGRHTAQRGLRYRRPAGGDGPGEHGRRQHRNRAHRRFPGISSRGPAQESNCPIFAGGAHAARSASSCSWRAESSVQETISKRPSKCSAMAVQLSTQSPQLM